MVSFQTQPTSGDKPPSKESNNESSRAWPEDEAANAWQTATATTTPPITNDKTTSDYNINRKAVPSALRPGFTGSAAEEGNVWDEPVRPLAHTTEDEVPNSLKPGGNMANSNPFRAAASASSARTTPPPQLPPIDSFSGLSLNQASNNPWGASLLSHNPSISKKAPQLLPEADESDPWSFEQGAPVEMPADPIKPKVAEEQSAWAETSQRVSNAPLSPETQDLFQQEHQIWGDAVNVAPPAKTNQSKGKVDNDKDDEDDWNMIDSETSSVAPDDEIRGSKAAKAAKADATEIEPTKTNNTKYTMENNQGILIEGLDEGFAPPAAAASSSSSAAAVFASEPPSTSKSTADSTASAITAASAASAIASIDPERPALPPRKDSQSVRWVPTRQPVDGKTEVYQVKNIRWHDSMAPTKLRTSPILIQNENGPCPLVALVNALSLTTPADIPDTALVQTLRSRETVSLNLVLDAVFDELMTPRRTSSDDALPDVTELYSFLQSLHTGMNVNPRFVPAPEVVTAYKRSSLTHLDPEERESLMPGTFENSMEMRLYATFSIPLIHGWLPRKSDAVYESLSRQAVSYEDVQNLLFREEELDEKLSSPGQGLSRQEQELYQDIMQIKMFMGESATQLTHWGIEVIGKAIRPGTFAILFRNDHFSTLYCHPQSKQLLTLVTDAGYSTHDEVVWESLVDLNGEHSKLFSGDFRPVGFGADAGIGSSSGSGSGSGSAAAGAGDGGSWTTVQNRRGKGRQDDEPQIIIDPKEQEDRDLALALQLQEEEEQREEQERDRRRRETLLSEQYIEQQGQRPQPVNIPHGRRTSNSGSMASSNPAHRSSNSLSIPVTNSGNANANSGSRRTSGSDLRPTLPASAGRTQEVRPLVPPRRPVTTRPAAAAGEEPPPPTYEQAASDVAYIPPPGHPSHASANSNPASVASSIRTANNRPPNNTGPTYQQRPMGGRTPAMLGNSGGGGGGGHHSRDRDCVIM